MTADGPKVIVIGAGISGLSAALHLARLGANVTVLEASSCAGGLIGTDEEQGFRTENGPHTFPTTAEAVQAICQMVGVIPQAVNAAAKKRYVYLKGKLVALPHDLLSAITSPVLSMTGKLAMVQEPFRPRVGGTDDMSIARFLSARFGEEAVANLVDPFVSGIYAGDVNALSMPAVFPKLWEAEKEAGSLVKGLRKKRPHHSPARARYALQSVPGGLQGLMDAMVAALSPGALRLNAPVDAVRRDGTTYSVRTVDGSEMQCAGIVLALPAHHAADLLQAECAPASEALQSIPYAGLAVVHTAFAQKDLRQKMDGFGFLVPRKEHMALLGCIWASALFDDRAPEDAVLLCNYIGGAHRPEIVGWEPEAIEAQVLADLRLVFRAPGLTPVYTRVLRHTQAIPQYNLGHRDRVTSAQENLKALPGLALCGNYLTGVSLNDCVATGRTAAETVLAQIHP